MIQLSKKEIGILVAALAFSFALAAYGFSLYQH